MNCALAKTLANLNEDAKCEKKKKRQRENAILRRVEWDWLIAAVGLLGSGGPHVDGPRRARSNGLKKIIFLSTNTTFAPLVLFFF